MKKLVVSIIILFTTFSSAFATHNRAGEITYQFTGDASHPYRYLITVTTYARWIDGGSVDRCELEVNFGDGTTAMVPRVNGPSTSQCPNGSGLIIANETRLNIYKVEHNFAGDLKIYTITVADPNRNENVCNIPNSVNVPFFLSSKIKINSFLGPNNSPVLLNPPIDDACVGACFEHNPAAYDADGDSLVYSLSSSYADGVPILGWTYPPNMGPNSIDPIKGDLVWCVPPLICEYNIAIVIDEYRLLPGTNTRYWIGSILRDMQIAVRPCNNTPPQINDIDDLCVIAGQNLNFNITGSDKENSVTLTAEGGPLETSNIPSATFPPVSGFKTVTGTFSWTPSCAQIQLLPYLVTFKATDNSSNPLATFETVFITVIAPPVTGLTATPGGASIVLKWNKNICDPLGINPVKNYYVYRKNSCGPWQPGPCETGVPSSTGYTLIGTTDQNVTTFRDDNGGTGLTNGVEYSYIIVALYVDGSESVASQNICAQLVRDVPIITNVSVLSTGPNDSIWTHWVKPIGTTGNLDTLINPPPYEYRLMRATGFNPSANTFTLEKTYSYPTYWQMTDTGYVSSVLNTADNPYTYKVDFYSNGLFKGSTQTASSVFLSSTPAYEKVNLSWQQIVSWNNFIYYIYRETSPGSNVFNLIDSTTASTYIDTSGLLNEIEYCYKILSVGSYSDPSLPKPLLNYSQIKCETPVDKVPPCQPTFDVITDCDILQNKITWINPNSYCSNDAVQINIYFAPTLKDPLQIIYSTTDMSLNNYTLPIYYFEGVPSIAGCYTVTAVDSALVPNESPIVNKICIDNCPEYELPNVFTPNGDGKNDFMTPLPHWTYVKDIDITIFDRWGLKMFGTTDPNVLWDGTNQSTKKECSDGTYFYTCTVNEITIEGIKPRVITGFVQIIRNGNNPSN